MGERVFLSIFLSYGHSNLLRLIQPEQIVVFRLILKLLNTNSFLPQASHQAGEIEVKRLTRARQSSHRLVETLDLSRCVTQLLPKDGAWWKTIERQKPANCQGPGSEIVQSKSMRRKEFVAGQRRIR